ncbi:MAG: hypothetical protein IPH81_09320 [Candidatus Microthrix sp.]|nr:hypothetical protein [Candidatus Microthrix sp.]MBK6311417.1 hypothetical protein [Candidatus Microthrix sp.]MBK6438204.1 hypothetical protein [Candidatus Microthrix sp.]MBK7165459.1 hypothetical protein [Candidatus Microthrix sp.]MBP7405062.1 hypothetical protein [Candidatus Microthrix sp.]MBP9064609.1 hypothetical protein [Candidatus Microthrix sp.]
MASGHSWFHHLVGFRETTGDEVRAQLVVDGDVFTSLANGRTLTYGSLATPSLAELRASTTGRPGPLSVSEIVADVAELHADPQNEGALFQVASQFNLLEMVNQHITPERGVTGYAADRTQGPACAVACGAGTIYRNWLVPIGNSIGQSETTQVDCLTDLGKTLGNDDGRLWTMTNGYALATPGGLADIADRVAEMAPQDRDVLMGGLRIGIQAGTEVTLPGAGHLVTQAYCSALPVGYSNLPLEDWEPFARLVLDAAYEATLLAGVANAERTGNKRLYLTLLGGGAFGNVESWILEAMERAFDRCCDADLDVAVVSYSQSRRLKMAYRVNEQISISAADSAAPQ